MSRRSAPAWRNAVSSALPAENAVSDAAADRCMWLVAKPAPRTGTRRAPGAPVTTSAPPPSDTGAQSRSRSGSAMTRLARWAAASMASR
ncbi:hypothetical protein E2I20_10300 [Alcaligenaceae bacterium SAGV3]|nr:hypothetical protein [Alcaligenaceae bacterium SAGV3]